MARTVVSLVRNLQRRNARRRQTLAVLEGVRLCEEALAADVPFVGVAASAALTRTDRGLRMLNALEQRRVPIESISDETLRAIADTDTPQGIVAIVDAPRWSLDDIPVTASHILVVLDAIQDPGNAGTIIRTAYAFGAAGVACLPGTVQLTNPKVLRSSLGASLRFPVVHTSAEEMREWTDRHEVELWVTAADGTDVRNLQVPQRVALVIGNEGSGVSPPLAAVAKQRVAIPIDSRAESLNAAVAAGILLYAVRR